MLRKKGQPEMDGLGTISGIHNKVDMMFKVLAHINDANLISSEAEFWGNLPSKLLAMLRDTTAEGMAAWDRDFVLKHVDLAMEATSAVLTTAKYPDRPIADLKGQIMAVWAKLSFTNLFLRHLLHQQDKLSSRVKELQYGGGGTR